MATSFATVNISSSRLPLGRPFPRTSASRFPLTIAARPDTSPSSPPAPFSLQLDRLTAGKSTREYQTGQAIFSQGDPSNAVYFVLSGKVKLTVVSMSGKEAVIAHLPVASFFGEAALAGQLTRISSATALEPSSIIRIDRKAMQELLHREPEFAEQFLAHLLSRNIRMEADLVDHLFNSSEKRLARLLMLMANFGQDTKPTPIIEKISQETLAEMIGTTRSRVSFFLNRFRELGYIDYDCAGMRINSSLVNIVLRD